MDWDTFLKGDKIHDNFLDKITNFIKDFPEDGRTNLELCEESVIKDGKLFVKHSLFVNNKFYSIKLKLIVFVENKKNIWPIKIELPIENIEMEIFEDEFNDKLIEIFDGKTGDTLRKVYKLKSKLKNYNYGL